MTWLGDDHVRRAVWLQLVELADALRCLADEWIRHDRELRELEDLVELAEEQPELPFEIEETDDDAPF